MFLSSIFHIMRLIRNSLLLIIVFCYITSCGNDDVYDSVVVIDKGEKETIKVLTANSFGHGAFHPSGAQGLAIYGNYLFRLHEFGNCNIYDISDLEDITFINSFKLGSYATNNHPNCAQFAPTAPLEDTGFPLLYTTLGNNNEQMAIEKISLEGSECLKKIIITDIDGKTSSHTRCNWIIGDDGFIWGMTHSGTPGNKDYVVNFYKLFLPESEDKVQTISIADAIDHFVDDDSNLPITWQGGMVRNGKLYFLFGTEAVNRQLRVYDTTTHKRLAIINLNKITSAEPEDIDLWQDNKIILGLYGVDYAILLQFVERTN